MDTPGNTVFNDFSCDGIKQAYGKLGIRETEQCSNSQQIYPV